MKPAGAESSFTHRYRFVIMGVSALVVFAAIGLARFGYTMLLPFMESALPLTKEEGGLVATANLTGYLIMSLAAGFLSVRFGAKQTIVCALGLTALALAATALARDPAGVFAARFLTGLASGGANVPVMALLSAWFSERERGLASGLAVGGTSLGLAVAGLTVPLFVSQARPEEWPAAWMYLAGLSAIVFAAALIFLRNRPAGSSAAGTGTAPEKRPLLSVVPGILKTRGFPPLSLAYFIYGFSYIIYATFFVNFLIKERGCDAAQAGGLWFFIGLAGLASGIFWGWISDRLGRTRTLAVIYVLLAVSFGLFALRGPLAWVYVSAFLFALCAWSVPAIMAATAGDILGHERAPVGFGVLTFCFGLGQAAGPTAAGLMAGAFASYAPAFLLAAVVSLAGAGLLLFTRTARKSPDRER